MSKRLNEPSGVKAKLQGPSRYRSLLMPEGTRYSWVYHPGPLYGWSILVGAVRGHGLGGDFRSVRYVAYSERGSRGKLCASFSWTLFFLSGSACLIVGSKVAVKALKEWLQLVRNLTSVPSGYPQHEGIQDQPTREHARRVGNRWRGGP